MAQILNNDNFNTSIENGVCVVDFFATWCGPCKMLAPVFEELSGEMNTANFFKVDVDQALDVARRYAITTVPTMIIFKDGEVADKMVGFLPKEHIKAKIEAQL
ncbi:MAG: thioredoxin [Terrisporobacter othiniensis]|uniref:Thioredoxin n=2 Tax=Terrisporobacter TaxID=1505652 RepID=A0AAX2ZKA2_9FIRM|nr:MULTISPECIES: thioredoxin [Terrisporobacter]MBN9648318.1 thioredoxin [Terrisporobacter glycolicus]MDU4861736.1 thioredoxin [Terrisporobacter othiniensis]MDU6994996.1 thioredoxin [Terrisporobacter othiniensis]UEL48950.1 thioredoxin [Terrisporobacter hibernicus]UPA31053.1 thioredoxin [Terrisporobacter glycolicus]